MGFPNSSGVKNPPAMQDPQEKGVRSLGWEDPLEKGMATHSSVLAWKIPWTEEPGGLQSTGSQRVRQDWATENRTAGPDESQCYISSLWVDSERGPSGALGGRCVIRELRQSRAECWKPQGATLKQHLLPWPQGWQVRSQSFRGLPCTVARTQLSPGFSPVVVRFHGNGRLHHPHWVLCPIYFYGTSTMAPTRSEEHGLKTEHNGKRGVHFPAVTFSRSCCGTLRLLTWTFLRSQFPCWRWPLKK